MSISIDLLIEKYHFQQMTPKLIVEPASHPYPSQEPNHNVGRLKYCGAVMG